MKLYHWSDLHGKKPSLPQHLNGNDDLFIFTGDIAPTFVESMTPCVKYNGQITTSAWGSYWNFRDIDPRMESKLQGEWIEEVFKPCLVAGRINLDRILFVPGNHEFVNPEKHFKHATCTDPKTIEIDGIKIALLPGSGNFTTEWHDELSDEDFEKRIQKIDRGVDILLTHQPPLGILDKTFRGERVGSPSLAKAIFGKHSGDEPYFSNLRLSLYGHIHDDCGKQSHVIENRQVDFYNACGPIGFEIEWPLIQK